MPLSSTQARLDGPPGASPVYVLAWRPLLTWLSLLCLGAVKVRVHGSAQQAVRRRHGVVVQPGVVVRGASGDLSGRSGHDGVARHWSPNFKGVCVCVSMASRLACIATKGLDPASFVDRSSISGVLFFTLKQALS